MYMYKIVRFEPAKNGGFLTKIDGKVAFPEKNSTAIPKDEEEWLVEIVGENPRGTVYFLRLLEKWKKTPQQCRELCKKGVLKENICRIFGTADYKMDGGFLTSFSLKDYPSIYEKELIEIKKEEEEREIAIQEAKEKALSEAKEIRKNIIGAELELRKVHATSYEIEVHEDFDWGRHKADPGIEIHVYPKYEGSSANPENEIIERLAEEVLGWKTHWTDVLDALEDEQAEFDVMDGPCHALVDLARDVLAREYIKIEIIFTDEQISEIKEKYKNIPDCGVVFHKTVRYVKKEEFHAVCKMAWGI